MAGSVAEHNPLTSISFLNSTVAYLPHVSSGEAHKKPRGWGAWGWIRNTKLKSKKGLGGRGGVGSRGTGRFQ